MADNPYKTALSAARKEMADLVSLKEQTEKRIAQLRQTIVSLTALSEEIDPDDGKVYVPGPIERASQLAAAGIMASMAGRTMGFTDAVREVLKATGQPMSPLEVRDGLIRMGIDLSKYTNTLAIIHSALKRLDEKGEVTKDSKEGKTTYLWAAYAPQWKKSGLVLKPLDERVENRLKKTRPAWAEYLAKRGGIVVSNPPYFRDGSPMSPRQKREAQEIIKQEQKREND